jgi:hypothetical protein
MSWEQQKLNNPSLPKRDKKSLGPNVHTSPHQVQVPSPHLQIIYMEVEPWQNNMGKKREALLGMS